ncbi:MAG TPA: M24 family metallopeptidase [Phycisphaerales bacterium]|nr:M24 family metallopeptidase [Phycisphaerales bacterium]
MNQTIQRRRERAELALQSSSDALVLVGAGEPIAVPGGLDRVYPFSAHPHHRWLTGRNDAGAVLAYDPGEGWRDFAPELTDDDRIWEGITSRAGEPISGLKPWLAARSGRPIAMLGVPVEGIAGDTELSAELDQQLLHARRPKDQTEITLMNRAIEATAAGFARARAFAEPGVTERAIQIELEAECFRHGGEAMGYGTIVGAGPNAAILHFAPSERTVKHGEIMFIDAGCEIKGYAADVSRAFVIGESSAMQRDLHAIVLDAERWAITQCTPGTEWKDLHLRTALRMTQGLIDLGILTGSAEGLVERDAHALFFPHGLGHLVGLGVRDASGYLPGRSPSNRFGLAFLRMDLPLEQGYITTVEPGLYFIEPLLRDPANRENYHDAVNWTEVDRWIGIGGIRIEDNILITDSEPINLTESIPVGL